MSNKSQNENIKLSDVIDIKFLQELQDNFAKSMNMASITIDNEGPITKPSNFTDFCIKYTRGSAKGFLRCNECDIRWGRLAAEKGKPIIFNCHSGLTGFAVPIMIEGKHIGSILGGQILTHKPDENHFRSLAKEFDIDEDEYIEALKKIKVISPDRVKAAAQLLFLVANSISEKASKNLELIKKNQRETLLRKIIEVIRSSLDINEVKKQITEEICKAFKADRCFFRYYDKVKDTYSLPDAESVSSFEIQKQTNVKSDYNAFKYFHAEITKYKKGFSPIVIDENSAKNTPMEDYMKSAGIKADYAIPISDRKEMTSWLVIHYAKEEPKFSEEYKKLLETIAFQIDTALAQVNLYDTVKKNAERQALLRKINETISSSLDIGTILSFICEEVTKLFNVQRTIVVEFPNPGDYSSYNVRKEYKTRKDLKSLSDIDPSGKAATYWGEECYRSGKMLIFDNISESTAPDYFKESYETIGVKSAIGKSVQKDDKKWGEIVLFEYDNYRHWTEDEIALLDTIANQIYISIHQAELYSKTKQQSEREALLRKIIETITSTLDIDKILSFICTEVAKLLNVQRTIIVEFYNPEDYSQYNIRSEYRARSDIKSIRDTGSYEQSAAYWGKSLFENSDLLILDNIENSNVPDYFKQLYKSIGVKSAIGVIVRKDQKKWDAILLFEYDNYRSWTNDEQNLLSAIANQIYISIKQAELYTNTKQQMEREKAILNNLPFLAWLKDEKGEFLAVNELFSKQYNMTVEEIIGKTDFDINTKELGEKYVKDDIRIMQTRQQIKIEEEIDGPYGTKWYETFKIPVYDLDGKVIGTTGFARDITEQKEVERMKNEFISVISHELRTPLTSIKGSLGLISSNALGVLPDKVNSLLGIANNNTIRLINLINDILDLEKIKAGKMDFVFEEHEVMSLIEETVTLNDEYARQYNVKYVIKNKLDNALINVDKNRFIQVLTNLLSNAAKFSYDNEEVYINIERKRNLISISVINKGNGIPEGSFSKIFQQFSQVDSSDTRKSGGTGLGLSICKSIIEKMGGTIGFTSKLKEYTTFYFELPEIIKNSSNKNVLICDDNKTSAFCIKAMFEKLNYSTDIAFTASEAMQLLQTKTFDLMTLDLFLPDQDGLTLLNRLKHNAKTKKLPVLIISAKKPDFGLIKEDHQVVDWIEKSFDIADLKTTINKIMHKKDQNKIEILHVENDKDILELIDLTLSDIANITQVKNLVHAENIIKESTFDIIILDYLFPEGTSDKLIPFIKSGPNHNAKLVVFSSYEESKIFARYADSTILKTNISNEQFKEKIRNIMYLKDERENK